MSKDVNSAKVIVPCRFSYLHCWEPDSVNGGDPKYSVSAIIPKSDTKTIEAIKAAVRTAEKDDLVLILGKGDETYMYYADGRVPFIGDNAAAREALKEVLG